MTSIPIGKHSARIEGDTLHLKLCGDLPVEDFRPMLQLSEQIIAVHGHYFALLDIRHLAAVPAETRRVGAEWARVHRISGNACYGGSSAMRTLITLVMRAINVVHSLPAPVAFFKTEHEAQAWIVEQRRKLA